MKAAASASNESHQSKANASDVAGQPPSQGIAFEPPEALLFEDKRPEAAAQRRLQTLANNSPQVQRLKAIQDMANNSPHAKQAVQLQERANNHIVRTAQRSAQHAGGSQQAPVMQRSCMRRIGKRTAMPGAGTGIDLERGPETHTRTKQTGASTRGKTIRNRTPFNQESRSTCI